MMFNLRWPFREDRVFSILSLIALLVPLAFSLKTYENFETVKFSLFLILIGWAVWEKFRGKRTGQNPGQPVRNLSGEFNAPREGAGFINKAFFVLLSFFLLAAALSTVFSPNLLGNLLGFYPRYTNGLIFYLSFAIFIFLLASTASGPKYGFLLKLLVFDALLIALYGILESAGIGLYSGLDASPLTRSPSFEGNPNFSSLFIAAVFPLMLVFFVRASKFAAKIYYGVSIAIVLWALMLFSSRGALLGAAVALAVLAALLVLAKAGWKYLIAIILSLIISAGLYYGFFLFLRPQSLNAATIAADTNVFLRLNVWDIAGQAIGDKPWLGVGPANFHQYYELRRDKQFADQAESFDDPHNLFLFQAATLGLPAVFFFWGMIILMFVMFSRQAILKQDFTLAALAAALAAWSVTVSFTPVPIAAFLILAVFLAGQIYLAEKGWFFNASRPLRLPLKTFGIALGLFGGLFLLSEHLFFYGYQAYFKKDYPRAAKFTRAAKIICPCNRMYQLYYVGSRMALEKDSLFVKEAINNFESSQSIQTRLRGANLRFLLYLRTRNVEYGQQAMADLSGMLRLNPNHAERLVRLAFYAYEMGQYNRALVYVNNGLSLNKAFFPAWMLKAKLHQILGEKELMLTALEKVRAKFPEDKYLKSLALQAKTDQPIGELPLAVSVNFDRLE